MLVVGLYGVGKAKGTLYIDDGHSYQFEKGMFGLMKFVYEEEKLKVSRVDGKGEIGREARIEKLLCLGLERIGHRVLRLMERKLTFRLIRGLVL